MELSPIEQAFSADYNNAPGESRSDYLKRVEASGLRVVLPSDYEVQIDIDSEDQYNKFKELLSMLSDRGTWVNIDKITTHPSRSGLSGKYHVTIQFDKPISMWERIAWQASLGSDSKRELFSCIRHRYGEINPVCFFEKKE